jgi:hypothetical protein
MPEIFTKNCKVTLIEYGARQEMTFKQLKTQISDLFARFLKK